MSEQWRAIAGFEGRYDVSDQGRVRSYCRHGPGSGTATFPRVLRHAQGVNSRGYCSARLGDAVTREVHGLVLEAFVGPRPPGCDASHLNGIRTDNRLENLVWETRSANIQRKHEHGTMPTRERLGPRHQPNKGVKGERNKQAKLTAAQVVEIRLRYAAGDTVQQDLADEYGVSRASITRVLSGQHWSHLTPGSALGYVVRRATAARGTPARGGRR